MKKLLLSAIIASTAVYAGAQSEVKVLDLTKASTELTFDSNNGAWTGTFDEETPTIESQCFSFVHGAITDYQTWWGFTASNSVDNSRKTDVLTYQYSNMACGGIVLNADGSVSTDDFGAPVTSADVPYLVAYYGAFMAARPVDMTFNDGKAYEAVGVYVNLNSYAYYGIEFGAAPARAFTNGDKFTLTIHGVAPDNSEKTVDVVLAKSENGDLTINKGWRYVDLSSLGVVNELYFTMASTDASSWGDNTPDYFCLDKLMVKEAPESSVAAPAALAATISYDRASNTVSVAGADFAVVYDALGHKVMTSDEASFNIGHLEAGVYIIKAAGSTIKIAK